MLSPAVRAPEEDDGGRCQEDRLEGSITVCFGLAKELRMSDGSSRASLGTITSLTRMPPVEWATKIIGRAPAPSPARVPASSTSNSWAWVNMSFCRRNGFLSTTRVWYPQVKILALGHDTGRKLSGQYASASASA